jgi:hypothetical protein
MTTDITVRDGVYVGPLRAPANEGRRTTGNIHSDDDARRLGFKGGLVAGSIHMEQLAPLLVHAFGERWLERGSISLYFLSPTLHGEHVRAFVGIPPAGADAQVEAWMERANGERICEGTAAVGDCTETTALHARRLDKNPVEELRILAGARAGDAFPGLETSVTREALERRLAVTTEPMPWYSDPSRFGGLVPTTVNQVNALIAPANAYLGQRGRGEAIGLYGAIELRNVNGPMLVETTYRAGGTLLHAGDTPKTEYLWFDTWADDTRGKHVAEMRMMLRFMKASSPLYADAGAREVGRLA